jgi:hypothetical protein
MILCAQAFVAAYGRREAIAQAIGELLLSAGISIRPGDVSYSKAEQAAHAAATLIANGGEEPPRLRGVARERLLGAPVEAVTS